MNRIIPTGMVSHKQGFYLSWLESLGVDTRRLSEEQCEKAAEPPSPDGCEKLRKVTALVVHHSATGEGSAGAFRVLHRLVNRWRDVGYHHVIGNGTHTEDGLLEAGRPEYLRGAHARGANDFALGICLVGNFSKTHPTKRQMATLSGLLTRLMETHGLAEKDILLHRQVPGSSTECPGKNLTLDRVLHSIGEQSDRV